LKRLGRRWMRWVGRGLALMVAGFVLATVCATLLLGSSAGRRAVLDALLAQVESRITGRLEIDGLERLDPLAVRLSGVRLYDPVGTEVLSLSVLGAELSPLELVQGRIVLRSLLIGPGRVDLRDLETPGRGLLAALLDPAPPASPAPDEPGPAPYVRVDRIVLTALDVVAPALAPPWDGLVVADLQAIARFELDGAPELSVDSLDAHLLRQARPLLRVAGVRASVARPGAPSELSLMIELGQARLRANARAVLPPAAAFETSPIDAELAVEGLSASELARLLADPELAQAFDGSAALVLAVSGSLPQLSLRGTLSTAAGALELRSELRERRQLDVGVASRELVLSRLRAELPATPLAFEAESSLDLTNPDRLPISVRLRSGQLGRLALPEVSARAVRSGSRLQDLFLELKRGESTLVVRGEADSSGAFGLAALADVRPDELAEWSAAAGMAQAPRGRLRADLRMARTPNGVLSIQGAVRANRLRLPQLGLDTAHVDVELDGPPLALRGRATARLTGLEIGERRVPRAQLQLEGGVDGYRVRASGDFERLRATLDLRARRAGHGLVVQGNAAGRYADTAFALRIDRTEIDPAGAVQTEGIALAAGEQRVELAGGYGRPDSALSIVAPELELAELAKLAGLVADWTGRARFEARLSGRPATPSLDVTLDVSDLSRAGESPLHARLAAQLDSARGRASVDVAVGAAPGSPWLDASASLASEFRGGDGWPARLLEARHHLTFELKRLVVAKLAPWLGRPLPVAAELAASVTLDGSLREPSLHASLRADELTGFGLHALILQQRLDYSDGTLATSLTVDDARGRWLNASAALDLPPDLANDSTALVERAGELAHAARWNVELTAAERALGLISAEVPPTLVHLALGGQLALSHDPGAEPAGHASFRVVETPAKSSLAGCVDAGVQLALEVELARQRLEASFAARHRGTELMRATTRASLELSPALSGGVATLGALSGELVSKELDLRQVPYLCQRMRGRLTARADLVDLLGPAPSLAADVQATGLSLGAEPSLDLQLTARADRDEAHAGASIRGPRGRSTLTARVPIHWASGRFAVAMDAPLSLQAQLVELPIAPLLDPAGALSYATGWVSGNVKVAGTANAPEPSGELELRDAELTATALAQPLHGVRGRFAFDQRRLRIERFEAKDRDGVLSLSGTVDRRAVDELDVKLDVRAKSFPLRQRGQVVATTSGHAKIDAALSRTHSNVVVQLMDADTWLENLQTRSGIDLRAHPDFAIAQGPAGTAPSDDASGSAEAAPSPAEPARESHIVLDASDHFWIKREDFAIQLATRLDATIAGEQTRITGRVDIFRGYLDMMGRVFDIDRNSNLEFTGGKIPDPVVDITASYEHRGSGKTVKVKIGGRGSKPVLSFFIDDTEVSAGKALEVLVGRRSSGSEDSAQKDATSFVSGLTAGLLATSARRELGAAAPIIMIEPGEQTGDGRIRAGFELDSLVPQALRDLITGVYVEGIVEREGSGSSRSQGQEASTQAGVLVELYFPHQLFSTGQWGPGTTWSLDWGWQL
jgi:translocation and assembly module TamB